MARFDFTADDLFGNEAAEDEEQEIFLSHLLQREESTSFENPVNGIKIVMAYKGQGKSSLLRSLASKLQRKDEALVIRKTGGAVFPDVTGHDPVKWAKAWKKELYKLIAVSYGAEIGFAWNDDAMSLVEEAEKEGSRRRSIFSAIYDRLKPTAKITAGGSAGAGLELGLDRVRVTSGNHESILRRSLSGEMDQIWLIIDDIDRNFRATKSDKAKIAGFFDAVRDMRNAIPQLRVRTSIRPNIYTSVRLDFESISHIRQYLVRLNWDEDQIRRMLARRVEGYLVRSAQTASLDLPPPGKKRDEFYISLLFESPVRWGDAEKPVHIALYTLSAGRPRWLIELCKRAASCAFERNHRKIGLDDVRREMEDFGEARRSDLVAEFGSKCEQLLDLFDAFHSRQEIYSTTELYALIEDRILANFSPNIAGLSGRAKANDVANFLFEVGLFHGRRELAGGKYEHIPFAKRPNAFTSVVNVEPEMRWEIHPVFRAALNLRSNYA